MAHKYEDFKIGMKVKISGCPSSWHSGLNHNCPFSLIEYPYYCTIKDIYRGLNSTAMTEGKYGWSLTALVDFDLIEIVSLKEERQLKLLKIKSTEIEF